MNKIFWGLLFLFINININEISLTPSFVGYILIYLGMKECAEVTVYQKTLPWVIAGGIWTAIFWLPILNAGYLGVIGIILQLYVTYQIIRGVEELEHLKETGSRSGKLRVAWYVEAVCTVLTWLLTLMGADPAIAVGTMVVSFVAAVIYIIAFYQCKKALGK